MSKDDEILALLREMRDIQQQHLEAYRAQSQRAISMSAVVVNRQLIALMIVIAATCGGVWYALSSPDVAQWKAIQDRAQQQLDQSDRQWQKQLDARQQELPIDDAK